MPGHRRIILNRMILIQRRLMGLGSWLTNIYETWVRRFKIAGVVILLFALSIVLLCGRGGNGKSESNEVMEWLSENNLGYIGDVVYQAGVTSLVGVLHVEKHIQNNKKLSRTLTREQYSLLKVAVKNFSEKYELEMWLTTNSLDKDLPKDYLTRLKSLGVSSVHGITVQEDEEVEKILSLLGVTNEMKLMKWMMKIQHLRDELQRGKKFADTKALVNYIKQRPVKSSSSLGWKILITGILICLVAMLVAGWTMANTHYYQVFPDPKASIYGFLTGRYATPHHSRVTWDWNEPQTVGKTMTFGVKFYEKNGSPYPVSDGDHILVEIIHEGVMVARTLEFAGKDPSEVNLIRCSFTVHKSGTYRISIMVGGRHIKDSPFTKVFEPGPIDPAKTGFTHYNSTVVFSSGMSHPLVIDTRDHFGNLAAYKNDNKAFFKIKVKEAGSNERYTPITQIVYNVLEKKLVMHIKIDKEGCFQAMVSYGDVKLRNGEFDILVLSASELNKVKKNVSKPKHNLYYESRLLSLNGEKLEKPKKVYVYISPKQITIKEFYLKIYPKKLCTFRVCPWTKFIFNGVDENLELPTLSIDDGSQPQVELAAKDRNTIVATFSCFLLKSIGGSETFSDKRDFFYHEIRTLHYRPSHSCLQVKVDRSQLLLSSYKAVRNFSPSMWCKRFEITFIGEQGLDWGGVSREWFECLCKELFDPTCSQLFTRFTNNPQGLVHPNPKRPPDKKAKLYEFAGKVVGKCLFESSCRRTQLVKARFSRSFLAQLIGLRVTYKHFETDDPDFYTTKISYIENNDVEDMELTFSEEVYNEQGQLVKVVDLIPNGSRIAVTNSNKIQYLDALAQYRMVTPIKEELEHFLKGLNSELIPENLLSMFDENELELLMCGTGTYSIADFKLHHTINGTISSKVLDWFWTIIASFTEEQMARLIQFTTGSSLLPPGGFAELNPKIQLSSAPTFNNLPSSHTCFNQLCLPDYDSMKTFHKMLLIAINEGNQGFAMA